MKKMIFIWVVLIMYRLFIYCIEETIVVIPIGEDCQVSSALETFQIKKTSYPFEWNITSFRAVYCSILDDFVDYTNPDYFTLYIDKHSPVNKYGAVIAHAFSLMEAGKNEKGEQLYEIDKDWKYQLPKIQAQYQRRINRFHEACSSSRKVYFLRYPGLTPLETKELVELIVLKYPHLDFQVVNVHRAAPTKPTWKTRYAYNYYIDPSQDRGDILKWQEIFFELEIINKKQY